MKFTPIEIQQHQFSKVFRGVDEREVRAFLESLAQQQAELNRENTELRTDLRRTRRELDDHKDRETALREAMLTAQRAIDEIREQAQKEAQLIVTEAEMRAEKIVHAAHGRVNKIIEDIRELKHQRVRLVEELRHVLNTHDKLLAVQAQEHESGQEAEVMVLQRPRAPSPPAAEESNVAKSG